MNTRLGLGVVVLLAACSSGDGDPATTEVATAPWPADEGHGSLSNDGTYWIAYLSDPDEIPLNEEFDVEVRIFDAETKSRIPAFDEVTLDARMPAHFHGLKHDVELVPNGDGGFSAKGVLFHMTGHWELYVDLRRGAITERAQFDVRVE